MAAICSWARLAVWLFVFCCASLTNCDEEVAVEANDRAVQDNESAVEDNQSEVEDRGGVKHIPKEVPELNWGAKNIVTIYFCEFLLSRWVLDRAPWNAYHSGLAFHNNATGEHIIFDYTPLDTTSVMKKLVPELAEKSRWRSLLLGDLHVTWHNEARMKFIDHWPKNYENFVQIGITTGSVVNGFADWVRTVFSPSHVTFDPIEVTLSNGSMIRSTMCHDFVTDSLWELYRKGVRLRPKEPIFRDHIMMYAQAVEPIAETEKVARHRREFLRYLRLLKLFYTRIADQFTYGREALIITWKLGLPVWLRLKNIDYRVHLAPPFLNYCYLPLAFPPHHHDLSNPEKLCALAMDANLTNTSVPLSPTGPIALGPEGRLDRDEALAALALVVFVAVLLVRPSDTPSMD